MLAGLQAASLPVVGGVAGQGHLSNLLGVEVVQVGLAFASLREAQVLVEPGAAHGGLRLVCMLAAPNGPAP